jgi:hypothetical protein
MFSYLSTIFSKPLPEPLGEQMLSVLWYSQKVEKVLNIVEKLTKLHETAPLTFMKFLKPIHVSPVTDEIVKQILMKYNAPKYGVCKWVGDYLVNNSNLITTAFTLAIGTEKASWNKEFYHKIRVLNGLEMGAWRKLLNDRRKGPEYGIIEPRDPIKYTIGLFNEPVVAVTLNTSGQDIPIISVYKNQIYRNTHSRSPIELALDVPFQQSDFHLFISEKKDENMVIITKKIGKNVVVPEGIYLVFIEDTESFGKGIYPYISSCHFNSRKNFFDMIEK